MTSETADLDRRLRALERRLTSEGTPLGDTPTEGASEDRESDGHDRPGGPDADAPRPLVDRVADLESRLDAVEDHLAEQEAAVQAVRGYVGNVRSVNRDVERRAESALAAVGRLERRLDAQEGRSDAVDRDRQQEPERERTTPPEHDRDVCEAPDGGTVSGSEDEPTGPIARLVANLPNLPAGP